MTQLTNETIEQIRENKALRKALIDYFDCTERTFYSYLQDNNPQLTQVGALKVIAIYLKDEIENLIITTERVTS